VLGEEVVGGGGGEEGSVGSGGGARGGASQDIGWRMVGHGEDVWNNFDRGVDDDSLVLEAPIVTYCWGFDCLSSYFEK